MLFSTIHKPSLLLRRREIKRGKRNWEIFGRVTRVSLSVGQYRRQAMSDVDQPDLEKGLIGQIHPTRN